MNKMSVSQAIRMMLVEKKMSSKTLASLVGISPQSLSNTLGRTNMTINRLEELLEVLDYEIVLQPKRRGSYAAGSYPVTTLGQGGESDG